MTKRSMQQLLKLTVFTSATLLVLSVRADLQERKDDRHEQNDDRHDRDDNRHGHDDDDDDDDHHGHRGLVPLPTGQFVTPTIIKDAVQRYLNPGLAGYPNFVAGEAVRSQLSPDGSTLAIITAGQNSLYKPDGTVDGPTDAIHLSQRQAPPGRARLTQVIWQTNSHVGLWVFTDATRFAPPAARRRGLRYTKSAGIRRRCRSRWASPQAPPAPPATATPASVCSLMRGMISADGHTLVVANNYNDSISVIERRRVSSATSTICGRISRTMKAGPAAKAAPFRSPSS